MPVDGLDIIPARSEHLDAIIHMLADDDLGMTRESTAPEARADYERAFAAIRESPDVTLYVALLDGKVIGTFQLVIIPNLSLRGTTRAEVEAVRVDDSLRGRGIGEALMRFAMEQARAAGAGILQLTSNKKRTDAHRFYERLGFVKSHDGFKIML